MPSCDKTSSERLISTFHRTAKLVSRKKTSSEKYEKVLALVLEKLEELDLRQLISMVWSLGAVSDSRLEKILPRLPLESLVTKDLVELLWAVARCLDDKNFVHEILSQINFDLASTSEISIVLWALVTSGFTSNKNSREQIHQLARVCTKNCQNFRREELVQFVWSFAKIGVHDPEMLSNFVERTRKESFTTRELTNLIWAHAKLRFRHVEFLTESLAKLNFDTYSVDDFGILASSLSSLRFYEVNLNFLEETMKENVEVWPSSVYSAVAEYLTFSGSLKIETLSNLAKVFDRDAVKMKSTEIVKLISAFAFSGFRDTEFLETFCDEVYIRGFLDLNSEEVARVVCSVLALYYRDNTRFNKVFLDSAKKREKLEFPVLARYLFCLKKLQLPFLEFGIQELINDEIRLRNEKISDLLLISEILENHVETEVLDKILLEAYEPVLELFKDSHFDAIACHETLSLRQLTKKLINRLFKSNDDLEFASRAKKKIRRMKQARLDSGKSVVFLQNTCIYGECRKNSEVFTSEEGNPYNYFPFIDRNLDNRGHEVSVIENIEISSYRQNFAEVLCLQRFPHWISCGNLEKRRKIRIFFDSAPDLEAISIFHQYQLLHRTEVDIMVTYEDVDNFTVFEPDDAYETSDDEFSSMDFEDNVYDIPIAAELQIEHELGGTYEVEAMKKVPTYDDKNLYMELHMAQIQRLQDEQRMWETRDPNITRDKYRLRNGLQEYHQNDIDKQLSQVHVVSGYVERTRSEYIALGEAHAEERERQARVGLGLPVEEKPEYEYDENWDTWGLEDFPIPEGPWMPKSDIPPEMEKYYFTPERVFDRFSDYLGDKKNPQTMEEQRLLEIGKHQNVNPRQTGMRQVNYLEQVVSCQPDPKNIKCHLGH